MTASIFVGLSTIDVVYEVDEFPSANSKVVAQSQNVCVGGPATNASITFALLGGSPTLVTTIGRHAMASVVRTELQRHSVQAIDLNPEFNEAPAISSTATATATLFPPMQLASPLCTPRSIRRSANRPVSF
jgi:sugar/nucleoside kinase (ribokinase family)